MVDDAERTVFAWLCEQYPHLQANADRDGWSHKLAAALTALRNGTPATEVCHRLGLIVEVEDLLAQRTGTGPATITIFVDPPLPPSGDYTCPHGRCGRRSQPNRDGHEPLCIDGTPMLPPGA